MITRGDRPSAYLVDTHRRAVVNFAAVGSAAASFVNGRGYLCICRSAYETNARGQLRIWNAKIRPIGFFMRL